MRGYAPTWRRRTQRPRQLPEGELWQQGVGTGRVRCRRRKLERGRHVGHVMDRAAIQLCRLESESPVRIARPNRSSESFVRIVRSKGSPFAWTWPCKGSPAKGCELQQLPTVIEPSVFGRRALIKAARGGFSAPLAVSTRSATPGAADPCFGSKAPSRVSASAPPTRSAHRCGPAPPPLLPAQAFPELRPPGADRLGAGEPAQVAHAGHQVRRADGARCPAAQPS